MSNSNVSESAIDALNQHTSSDDGVSDADVDRLAHFIEMKLMRENGKLSSLASRAFELHAEAMADAMDEMKQGTDETVAAFLGRLSLIDYDETGFQMNAISWGVITEIARDHFDEFSDEARNLGWLE